MLWATQRLDPYLIWLCCRSSKGKGGRKGGGKGSKKGKGKGKAWRNWNTLIIELDDGKIYRKALYLMVKTMVSCRFSLKPIQWFEAFGYHLMQPGFRLTADPRNDGTLGPCDHARLVLCMVISLYEVVQDLVSKNFCRNPWLFMMFFTIRLLSKSPFLGLLFGFSISFYSHRFTSHSLRAGRTPSQAWWGPGGSRRQVPVVSVGARETPPTSASNSASSASLCFHAKLPAKLSSLTPGPQVL